jgi:hypothetical protein
MFKKIKYLKKKKTLKKKNIYLIQLIDFQH